MFLMNIERIAFVSLALAVPAAAQQPPAVITAEVVQAPFALTVEALGTARANEAVEIRAKVTDRISAIRFDEGARVDAGAVLVELENAEALAAVASARAAEAESASQLRRARELGRSRSVSASEIEQLTARRDADRAALEAARARLDDTIVRAPFAGRVGLRQVSVGSLVGPGTVITTLDDTATIKLDFAVPESVLGRLETGLPVEAHSIAWRDEIFTGRVSTVDTRVDPVSRTVTVRALLANDQYKLRPGMFLTVTLLKQDVTALVVPEQAIVPEQSRQFVYLVSSGGRAEKREIRTGRRRPGQVEVLQGLNEGDRVITEGTQKARHGEPVRIIERGDAAL